MAKAHAASRLVGRVRTQRTGAFRQRRRLPAHGHRLVSQALPPAGPAVAVAFPLFRRHLRAFHRLRQRSGSGWPTLWLLLVLRRHQQGRAQGRQRRGCACRQLQPEELALVHGLGHLSPRLAGQSAAGCHRQLGHRCHHPRPPHGGGQHDARQPHRRCCRCHAQHHHRRSRATGHAEHSGPRIGLRAADVPHRQSAPLVAQPAEPLHG